MNSVATLGHNRGGTSGTTFTRGVLLVLFVGVVLPGLGSVISSTLLPDWRWDQVPFHSAIEVAGGLIALALAGVLLAMLRPGSGTRHHLWMAAALVGMGVLDIAHGCVPPGETFVWFHSTATFVGGVLFAMVWLPARIAESLRCRLVLPLTSVAVFALCVCTLSLPAMIPAMVHEGAFTATARGLNIFGGVGFLAAAGWFLKRHRATPGWDHCLFACLCGLFGAAGVLFELSFLWDAAWWWWHVLRVAAYVLAITYSALLYHKTSAQLKITQRKLEQTSMEMAIGLSEVCDGLGRLANGDPDVRVSEDSNIELISRTKVVVNSTARSLGELVDQFHEMAISLAEHFGVLHRVTQGDMSARIAGTSENELLGALKDTTNQTIETLHLREQELLRERTNLQAIFDASQVGMLLVDEDTQVTRVNEVIAQFVDKETSELLGHQPGDGLCCIYASETPAGCGHAAACRNCRTRNVVERVLKEGQTIQNAELTMRLAIGGEEKQPCFTANVTPLSLEGRKYALLALLDITDRKKREKRDSLLNVLQRQLLVPTSLAEKMQLITDAVTEMVDADFTRIWLTQPGDRCDRCVHDQAPDKAHVCEYRDRCLHLVASSGRYTHIDGETHRRVPFGCYKIGRVAAGEEARFLTNEVTTDPRVHNHQWAAELGLVSFAGYQLQDMNGRSIGVMALFAAHPLSQEIDEFLDNIAHLTSQVIMADQAEAERKRMQEKLVETSRLAGMAEVATGVLHNVGNVLNSVNVSAQLVTDRVKESRVTGLAKAK